MASFEDDDFIIRKRKKIKKEKPEGLKIILKVGGSSTTSTPEHTFDSTPIATGNVVADNQDENIPSPSSIHFDAYVKQHKKSKKKKKKKEKDYEKRDKKKKHRKDKKKKYGKDYSQEDIKGTEENGNETLTDLATSPISYNENKKEVSNVQESFQGPNSNPKQKNEKTALQKLLEYIHQVIEKKDIQQFFAWPVTDQIAPGYSLVISQPMDLNSMKRNIENHCYGSLPQYIEDLQIMCSNAMIYNRPETVYYKAAKKLLHAGLKITSADKLRSSISILPFLSEISAEDLGFDLDSSAPQSEEEDNTKPGVQCNENLSINDKHDQSIYDEIKTETSAEPVQNLLTKLETLEDDYSPDEILAQAKKAAKDAADKLALKKTSVEMGFLRQNDDGTTTLAIIVPNDGVDQKTKERPVLLGSLIGRLNHGSGSVQGFREDKRNFVKPVKPLYYGAFGSYAPSYDSTFANLTKDESQLLFQTYGDETAVQYAESLLNFSRDCDYVTTMVDNLLDIMTGGDHRKTKKILEEKKKIREEEEAEEKRLKNFIENKKSSIVTSTSTFNVISANCNGNISTGQSLANMIKSAAVPPVTAGITKPFHNEDTKLELNQLKSLSEYGIDTSFLDYYEGVWKEEQKITDKLEQTRSLLERLHQTQYERLSAPLPPHLSQISPSSETEHSLADKVTESLTNIIKKVPPGVIAPVTGIRKAMGIAPVPPQVSSNGFTSQFNGPSATNTEDNYSGSNLSNFNEEENLTNNSVNPSAAVAGFDLESEIRELLESDPALTSFHLSDDVDDTDKTIEQMFSVHS